MKLGVIHGDRYSFKWVPEGNDKGIIFQWFLKGIKLGISVESFCCGNCKKIIIDVEDKVD